MSKSSLAALEKLIAPPKEPTKPPMGWPQIELLLGATFPDDYKAYVEAYGVGSFNGLGVGDVRHGDLVTLTNALGAALVLQREGRDAIASDRFFPAEGGLFPIGNTGNGDTLWLRLADGGVVLTDGDDTQRDEQEDGLTTFLVRILSGEHRSPVLPSSFVKKKPVFTPFRKKVVVRFAFDPPHPAFADVAAALKAHLGKSKALAEKSYVVEYETPLFAVSATSANDSFSMSTRYEASDEIRVREVIEGFFAKASLRPTSITDAAKNPAWQPAPRADVAPSAQAVRARVAPPADPAHARGDWASIERVLGTGLPPDHRELIEAYGSGTFGGSLRLFGPFDTDPEHALVRQWFERLPALHLRRGSYPAASGLVPFVKSGTTMGLLPIGTLRGGVVCFDVRGAPTAWKVVVLTDVTDTTFEAHAFDGGLAAFVVAALDGRAPSLEGPLRASFEP